MSALPAAPAARARGGHPGPRADQAVRPHPGPRPAGPDRPARLDLRPARAQRGGQDDHHPDPDRAGPAQRRERLGRRRDRRPGPAGAAPVSIGYLDQDPRFYGWMRGRELLELVGRLHGLEGAELRARVVRDARADRPDRRGRAPDRRLLGRHAPAAGHRPGDAPRAPRADPGRAGQLARSGGPARPAGADQQACGATRRSLISTHVLADVERICDRVAILAPRPPGHRGSAGGAPRRPRPARSTASSRQPARMQRVATLVAGSGRRRGVPTSASAGEAIRVTVSDPAAAAGAILPSSWPAA